MGHSGAPRHRLWFTADPEQRCNAIKPLLAYIAQATADNDHLAKYFEGFPAIVTCFWQHFRNCSQCRLLVDEEHEKLFAHEGLEVCERFALGGILRLSQTLYCFKTAFINGSARAADIKKRTR